MTNVNLEPLRAQVELLRYVKAEMAKLREVEKHARAAVEDAMGQHDCGLLDGDPAIHWPHFKENRFDQSAFGEDHPDLLEQYRAMRDKRRFEVV